jgi:hypothetical protein
MEKKISLIIDGIVYDRVKAIMPEFMCDECDLCEICTGSTLAYVCIGLSELDSKDHVFRKSLAK